MTPLLEICVDDAAGLKAAIAGGADRIELCAALMTGGLTPAPGLMARAARQALPVYALIRPRAGDFVFSPADEAVMLADIDAARAAGLAGVVLGASRPDGRLDLPLLRRLIVAAQGMGLTLHRAFDLVPDVIEAVDQAVDLGFQRILTSGGAPTAAQGVETLARITAHARDRISIMPGSGITAQNAAALLARLGVRELHASGGIRVGASAGRVSELGFDSPTRRATDRGNVAALRAVIGAAGRKDC